MQNFSNPSEVGGTEGVPPPVDDSPWWLKYAAKFVGVAAGAAAIFFGLWTCVTISPLCLVAGVWQMVAGFFVIVIEAPYLCVFLDFVQQISNAVQVRPPWQKAALYALLSLPSLFLCLSFTTLLGSGAIFAVAVLQGMQVIGKKASREEMAAKASGGPTGSSNDKSGLVGDIHGQDVEAAKGNI